MRQLISLDKRVNRVVVQLFGLSPTRNRNRNRKLEISTALTKAKSRNQLIQRRLSKRKSIGSGSDLESQAGRQSDGYGEWCLELRREGGREKRMNQDRIVEEQCFKLRVKELWRNNNTDQLITLESALPLHKGVLGGFRLQTPK